MATLSGLLSAELAATCNALGYYDGNKYHLEPHCKETVKDLIRYLRRDESTHDIRRYLGNAKLLQTDLLPIIQCHHEDKELFDILLRLIVNLTNPALLLYNEVIPTDKNEHNLYLEILSHLQNYKEVFCNQKFWVPITERLGSLLNKNPDERDEDDDRTIERILILVRNVLHIPVNAESEWRPDNDASVHDQVIWALHQSGLLDLLLYIVSSSSESNFSLHLLEIICLLVREQPPTLLAKTASQRSTEEKNRDDEELLRMRQSESLAKQRKVKKFLGTRHSNFGGTYIIKNMKSTSDRELIYHKPIKDENDISLLDKDKKKLKVPKNRRELKSENFERRSALSIRLILKQFCVEILNAAYNPLMKLVKELLVRGKSQNNDESYYFTAIKFFMEFNRNYKFQVKLVSETMSVETFHFAQKYLENWFEMMTTDKKRIPLWSSRMHIALNAYKELLYNLALMDTDKDSGVRESSKVIKSNIFYVIEYREMLLILINTFDKTKYSRQYLKDLVETLHVFLKLLSAFTRNKKVVVQKQVRKKKAKKSKKSKKQTEVVNLEDSWRDLSERLSAVLMSPITVEVIPFDAASDMSMEEQKEEAVKKINTFLKTDKLEEAVALLRSSREVWPENDTFGSSTFSPEEELAWFKEVYLADLQINPSSLPDGDAEEDDNEDNEEVLDDEEEEIENYRAYAEQNFDVMDLIRRFASPKMMAICISLLQTFETNSDLTNHCIAKMLHRIAWDCKLPAMLFQASLFCTFQKILNSDNLKFKELAKLAIYIIRKFTEIAQTNKKVFAELLFYKTAKEAYEIEHGYGAFIEERTKSKLKAAKVFWEEHEEEELKRLYEEYMENKPSNDAVDWIMDNLINKERSRRGVMKKMKELNLIIEKPKKQHHHKYTEEQEDELRRLFETFRETSDPVKNIMDKLSFTMSRSQVKNTLLRLKVVQDKQELKKKRTTKPKKGKNKSNLSEGSDESEDRSESSSDSDMDELSSRRVEEEPTPSLPVALIKLVEVMHLYSYISEGLKWIKASMQECLEDLDDDPAEVPLLPLSADSILSIDNKHFQRFLKALQICEPQQQEVYWRIPAAWKDTDLLKRIHLFEILLSHDEDELSSYSDELNIPIKQITGESCDMGKLIEEMGNDIRVQVENEVDAVDNFNDIIADHCRKALDNELVNENLVENEAMPGTSKDSSSSGRKDFGSELLSINQVEDVDFPGAPSTNRNSKGGRSKKKSEKKIRRFESSDDSGSEYEKATSRKISRDLSITHDLERNSKLIIDNFLEKDITEEVDNITVNKEITEKFLNTKKTNFSKKKRIVLQDSSDDETGYSLEHNPNNPLNHTLLKDGANESGNSRKRSLRKLESDSDEDSATYIKELPETNVNKSNNDLKRGRPESEESSPKNKPKKRMIIESDEE